MPTNKDVIAEHENAAEFSAIYNQREVLKQKLKAKIFVPGYDVLLKYDGTVLPLTTSVREHQVLKPLHLDQLSVATLKKCFSDMSVNVNVNKEISASVKREILKLENETRIIKIQKDIESLRKISTKDADIIREDFAEVILKKWEKKSTALSDKMKLEAAIIDENFMYVPFKNVSDINKFIGRNDPRHLAAGGYDPQLHLMSFWTHRDRAHGLPKDSEVPSIEEVIIHEHEHFQNSAAILKVGCSEYLAGNRRTTSGLPPLISYTDGSLKEIATAIKNEYDFLISVYKIWTKMPKDLTPEENKLLINYGSMIRKSKRYAAYEQNDRQYYSTTSEESPKKRSSRAALREFIKDFGAIWEKIEAYQDQGNENFITEAVAFVSQLELDPKTEEFLLPTVHELRQRTVMCTERFMEHKNATHTENYSTTNNDVKNDYVVYPQLFAISKVSDDKALIAASNKTEIATFNITTGVTAINSTFAAITGLLNAFVSQKTPTPLDIKPAEVSVLPKPEDVLGISTKELKELEKQTLRNNKNPTPLWAKPPKEEKSKIQTLDNLPVKWL